MNPWLKPYHAEDRWSEEFGTPRVRWVSKTKMHDTPESQYWQPPPHIFCHFFHDRCNSKVGHPLGCCHKFALGCWQRPLKNIVKTLSMKYECWSRLSKHWQQCQRKQQSPNISIGITEISSPALLSASASPFQALRSRHAASTNHRPRRTSAALGHPKPKGVLRPASQWN